MHFFRKEDDAGATPAGGSNLLLTALRRRAAPGDDVASSIQACEACRVGASPTHLTNFICAHGLSRLHYCPPQEPLYRSEGKWRAVWLITRRE